MMSYSHFKSLIDEPSGLSEQLSLKYAIWAHGAQLLPSCAHLSETFYCEARKHIDSEDENREKGFFTIESLQASILIALYEIKQTRFTRSWASVARATCLAHTLALHAMDQESPLGQDSGDKSLLPACTNPSELEERRRTFWTVLQLNCFQL